jgi:hypothetical protein
LRVPRQPLVQESGGLNLYHGCGNGPSLLDRHAHRTTIVSGGLTTLFPTALSIICIVYYNNAAHCVELTTSNGRLLQLSLHRTRPAAGRSPHVVTIRAGLRSIWWRATSALGRLALHRDAGDTNETGALDCTVCPEPLDGLNNGIARRRYSGPSNISACSADTRRDGLSDGMKFMFIGPTRLVADTEDDGLSDGDELLVHGTVPLDRTPTANGFPMATEVMVLWNRSARSRHGRRRAFPTDGNSTNPFGFVSDPRPRHRRRRV